MTAIPDLLTALRPRQQERLPLEIGHAREWCPARNCRRPCGPFDCTCRPCRLGRCARCPTSRPRVTRTLTSTAPRGYQPSLLTPPPKEVIT